MEKIHEYCGTGNIEKVREAVENGTLTIEFIQQNSGYFLCDACFNGHLEIVKYLVTIAKLKNAVFFEMACLRKQFHIADYLFNIVSYSDIRAYKDALLKSHIVFNDIETVKYLINKLQIKYVTRHMLQKVNSVEMLDYLFPLRNKHIDEVELADYYHDARKSNIEIRLYYLLQAEKTTSQ